MCRAQANIVSDPQYYLADSEVRNVNEPFVLYALGRNPVELRYPHDPAAPAGETINCGCTMIPIRDNWSVTNLGRAPGGLAQDISIRDLLAKHS